MVKMWQKNSGAKTYSIRSKNCKIKELDDIIWGQKKKKQSRASLSKENIEELFTENNDSSVKVSAAPYKVNNQSSKTMTSPINISGCKLYSAVVDTNLSTCSYNAREEPLSVATTSTELLFS